jgi:hypothetical protein
MLLWHAVQAGASAYAEAPDMQTRHRMINLPITLLSMFQALKPIVTST